MPLDHDESEGWEHVLRGLRGHERSRTDAVLPARFELLRTLGAGGMGEVFEARDTVLGRVVAVKRLRPTADLDPVSRARHQREGEALARIRHPGVVRVHELLEEDDARYLVLERVEGPTLAARIEAAGALPAADVRELGIKLAEALAAVHAAGVVHRDVKPSNVLLTAAGPTLIDLGIARAGQTALTRSGHFVGTPAVMAPEQLDGEATPQTDLFALGATLYHALSGRPTLDVGDAATPAEVLAAIGTARVPALAELCPDAPGELTAAIHRCLARRPEQRFATAAALRDALARRPSRGAPRPGPAVVASVVAGIAVAATVAVGVLLAEPSPVDDPGRELPGSAPPPTPVAAPTVEPLAAFLARRPRQGLAQAHWVREAFARPDADDPRLAAVYQRLSLHPVAVLAEGGHRLGTPALAFWRDRLLAAPDGVRAYALAGEAPALEVLAPGGGRVLGRREQGGVWLLAHRDGRWERGWYAEGLHTAHTVPAGVNDAAPLPRGSVALGHDQGVLVLDPEGQPQATLATRSPVVQVLGLADDVLLLRRAGELQTVHGSPVRVDVIDLWRLGAPEPYASVAGSGSNHVALDPRGGRFLSGTDLGDLRIYDLDGQQVGRLTAPDLDGPAHAHSVEGLALSATGDRLVSISARQNLPVGELRYWRRRGDTWDPVGRVETPGHRPWEVALAPDGAWVAVATRALRIELRTGR